MSAFPGHNPLPNVVMAAPLTQSEISRLLEERHPGSTRGSCPAPTAANIASWLRQFEEMRYSTRSMARDCFHGLAWNHQNRDDETTTKRPCGWVVQGCNCRGCLSYVITIPSYAILILFLILDENSEREISELAERLERAHPGCIFGPLSCAYAHYDGRVVPPV